MAILPGDNASYLGAGSHADRPDPTNVAPHAVVRYYETDTQMWCDWVAGMWLCERIDPAPPLPPPGPALDQYACNVAGYITYEVLYKIVKTTLDAPIFSAALDWLVGSIPAIIDILIPPAFEISLGLKLVLDAFVRDFVNRYLDDFLASLVDSVLWSKIHCYLYNAVHDAPGSIRVALLTAAAALAGSTLAAGQVVQGVVLLLQQFGLDAVGPISLASLTKQYSCTDCATSGQASGPGIAGVASDLVLTDGTTRVTQVNEIIVPAGTLSAVGQVATLTEPDVDVPPGTLQVVSVSANYTMLDGDDLVRVDTSGGDVTVTLPPASGTVKIRRVVNNVLTNSHQVTIQAAGSDTINNADNLTNAPPILQTAQESYALLNASATNWDALFGSSYAIAASAQVPHDLHAFVLNAPLNLGDDLFGLYQAIRYGAQYWVRHTSSATVDLGYDVHLVDATSGNITLTLGGLNRFYGKTLYFVRLDNTGHTVTLATHAFNTEPIANHAPPMAILPHQNDFLLIAPDQAAILGTGETWVILAQGNASGGGVGSGTVTSVSGTAPVSVSNPTTTPNVSVAVMGAAGGSHGAGLAPDPGGTALPGHFLAADATYSVPAGGTPLKALDYTETADVFTATAISSGAWSVVGTSHSFSLTSGSSLVEIVLTGYMRVVSSTVGGQSDVALQVVIDPGGGQTTKALGGANCTDLYNANPLQGGSVYVSGLAAGSHSVRVEIYPVLTGITMYLRCASASPPDAMHLEVIEHL